jgi:hypothetical protein
VGRDFVRQNQDRVLAVAHEIARWFRNMLVTFVGRLWPACPGTGVFMGYP